MTRTEMIGFIRENPYVKITHTLFSKDEYIYSKGDGRVYEEHDYLFEDFISERSNGLRMRTGGLWDNGWSLYEEVKKRDMDYRYSHTGKEIREWCEECTNNDLAREIKKEYFSKRGNQPSDRVYYFIETFPKPCLVRDYEKSPKTRYSKRY
jgi:hypothetical protein